MPRRPPLGQPGSSGRLDAKQTQTRARMSSAAPSKPENPTHDLGLLHPRTARPGDPRRPPWRPRTPSPARPLRDTSPITGPLSPLTSSLLSWHERHRRSSEHDHRYVRPLAETATYPSYADSLVDALCRVRSQPLPRSQVRTSWNKISSIAAGSRRRTWELKSCKYMIGQTQMSQEQ
jgi:hypothetical protein